MINILEKHARFFTLVAIIVGAYLWHVAAQPAPAHPRLTKAWSAAKSALWLFVGLKAVSDQPAEDSPSMAYQLAPPPSYGELPEREVGDDGHQLISHEDGW